MKKRSTPPRPRCQPLRPGQLSAITAGTNSRPPVCMDHIGNYNFMVEISGVEAGY